MLINKFVLLLLIQNLLNSFKAFVGACSCRGKSQTLITIIDYTDDHQLCVIETCVIETEVS